MDKGRITPGSLIPALVAHAARRGFPLGYAGGDPVAWRDSMLPKARAMMLPDLVPVPFAPVTEAEEDRGDHLIRRIRVQLCDGMAAPALFAVPKGSGPFPAALALHDHGSEFRIGKEKCLAPPGPVPDAAQDWWDRYFGGLPMAEPLVRRGFAVLCLDAPGWGDRAGNGYDAQQALGANLLNLGISAAGLMAWEDLRAAEFLAGCTDVDPSRIAAVGFSMGAFRAWQVAALSPHVSSLVAASWMASLPGLLVEGNNHLRGQSAFWMTHPFLHRDFDLPDIAALAAPKPALFLTGIDDPLFPATAVDPAFDRLAQVWAAHGAGDRLALHRVPGGHAFGPDRQALAFDWLKAHV